MDQDLKEFVQPHRRGRPDRAVHRRGDQHGIRHPDFRSPGGIWTKQTPIDFSDFMRSDEARRETWRRRFAMEPILRQAAPNRGHRAVAELIRTGKAAAVITQNIDGLHQDSGIPDDKVIELHGNTTYAHCLDCGMRYEIEALRVDFEQRSDRSALRVRRLGEDRDGLVRPVDADQRNAPSGKGNAAGGFVHRDRIVAGGVPGGRISRSWPSATVRLWSF